MFSGGGCVDAVREAGDCEFVESPEALAIVTLLLHWFDTRVELQMLSASYSHPTHLKEWDPSHEVDVFFNVTSHLTQLPIFLTPMCEGLYSLQWAVVIALLGSVILLVGLLTLASRREKYNHMVVLAYLKRDLANELDKNNDGKIDSSEAAGQGQGYLDMLGSQFAARGAVPPGAAPAATGRAVDGPAVHAVQRPLGCDTYKGGISRHERGMGGMGGMGERHSHRPPRRHHTHTD